MLWVSILMSTHNDMFLWRNMKNYPQIIIKAAPVAEWLSLSHKNANL